VRSLPAQRLAHAGKGQRQMVLAMINTAFARDTQDTAIAQWRTVADQLRVKFPKLAVLMDSAEADVLALMGFASHAWLMLCCSNKTMNGRCSVATCSLRDYKLSATINPLACRLSSREHESNQSRTHDSYHLPGHDPDCNSAGP
jgi:hypothetical protein